VPKSYRIVLPNYPHHIVQRGSRRQRVFFNEIDKKFYLTLLATHTKKHNVHLWAYCLMDNHVHLILVPSTLDGLAKSLAEVHRSYTTMINRRYKWRGYLWQGRFSSSVIGGEMYLWRAIRYVERNPVRVGLVRQAEEYCWSSAKAHALGHKDLLLSPCPDIYPAHAWKQFLCVHEPEDLLDIMRRSSIKGVPVGDNALLHDVSRQTGIYPKDLILRPSGRPRQSNKDCSEQSEQHEQK